MDIINLLVYHWRRSHWMIDPNFYLNHFENIKIKSPIFLLGNQGDGLTIISRVLRRIENVISVSGNYNYWAGADEMQQVFGLYLPKELTGLRHKAPQNSYFEPPLSWSYSSNGLLKYFRKTKEDFDPEIKIILQHIIKYCINKHSSKNNENWRFIDKSQSFTVKVSFINELLKDYNPKFILISRDPYASCLRAAKGKAIDMKNHRDKYDLIYRLKICCEHWENSMRLAFEDANKDNINLLHVRFEDFLIEPEKITKQICEHSQLNYNDDLLPKSSDILPLGIRFEKRWYPINKNVNEPYYNKLTKENISIINKYCGEMASKLGYKPPF